MSSENPLITVITVCYQSAEFLEQCMQSVLGQTFDDFEYIVIDGGSTDGSADIIRKYGDQLAYWHSKPDRGLTHAFNLGLEQSRGKWIAYLNSDDMYVDPSALSSIAPELKNADGFDVVHGTIQHVSREVDPEPVSAEFGGPWKWEEFRHYSTIPHPAAFFRKEMVHEIGNFDESFRNALDYEFFLRKGPKLKVKFIPKLMANMRMGGISTLEVERSIRESRDAQIKNGANNLFSSYLWWAWLIMRIQVKKVLGS